MSITVLAHQHDPALTMAGANGQELIIQTGTIVFEFLGIPGADWVHAQLVESILDVSSNISLLQIRSIASAAPSSMSYFPSSVSAEEGGLVARGNAIIQGYADINSGQVVVEGIVQLPVIGVDTTDVSIPRGGWAVDRTETAHSGNQIQLVVDLAVLGPSSVFRLAYSLFVRILPLEVGFTATETRFTP